MIFQEKLPLTELDIVPLSETDANDDVIIRIEARSTALTQAAGAPAAPNTWCYVRSGSLKDNSGPLENYLGPVINVRRGCPLEVRYVNTLGAQPPMKPGDAPSLQDPPIELLDTMSLSDKIPQLKSMNMSVGVVTHLHGAKVEPHADGWPLAPISFSGNPFHFPTHRTYTYPNDQRAVMLWFHDHGMDNTATQVHAGLAGLYFIRDHSDEAVFDLIGGPQQEIPLVIQDRILTADGTRFNYKDGIVLNAAQDRFLRPEFLGQTLFVNGRQSPYHEVCPKIYRLRILNGSNARTYALALAAPGQAPGSKVWYSDLLTVIGNDGGLFCQSKRLGATDYLLLAPAERLDILMDLTSLDTAATPKLDLINLAIQPLVATPDFAGEPIFDSDEISVVPLAGADDGATLTNLTSSAKIYAPLSQVLEFTFGAPPCADRSAPLDAARLDAILKRYADDEAFRWDPANQKLQPNPQAGPVLHNRLVLFMNDTLAKRYVPSENPNPKTGGPWRDTQIWEMRPTHLPKGDKRAFTIPFDARLGSPSQEGVPAPGGVAYEVARAWFFEPEHHADPMWSLVTENVGSPGAPVYRYPELYHPDPARGRLVIKPRAGSYERWYVANIGNDQPLTDGAASGSVPDMHPFHIHVANFVVTRRFLLTQDPNTPGQFIFAPRDGVAAPAHPLDFDGKVRHDTVRIQTNEMVELLIFFPKGYTGKYPYHCHIVEHEDMGMMLHFEVQP